MIRSGAPWLIAAATLTLGGPVAAERERPDEPARFLVVIGYNAAAPDPRPTLSFADDDAARFFQLQLPSAEKAWLLTTFDDTTAAAYPDLSRVTASPTLEELARVLGEIAWRARALRKQGHASELMFYFAGHGDVTPAGEGFLVLADGRLTRSELLEQVVQGSETDLNHLILDACASYFMVRARGDEETVPGRPLSPELLDAIESDRASDDVTAWANTGVLVSTSTSASVHETAALGSGIFSYLLRSGLAGAADLNGDGRLEYGELAAFIASASADIGDPRARLAVHARAPAQRPHAPLADLSNPGFDRFLRIASAGPSRLRVLDARGLPYVEVHRQPGREVTLALVGGPYFVVQRDRQEALLVPRQPGAYALDALEFYEAPTARALEGPGSALFRSAFGEAFATGFFAASGHLKPADGDSFRPAFAEAGAPPFELTPWPFAVGALGFAGVSALVSGAALGVNLLAFTQVQQGLTLTGTIDPTWAATLELSRLVAFSTAGLAMAAALGAGALGVWAVLPEDRE